MKYVWEFIVQIRLSPVFWQVYASPSRRKMDTKGEGEEMTYPHICFMVDNFDEVTFA